MVFAFYMCNVFIVYIESVTPLLIMYSDAKEEVNEIPLPPKDSSTVPTVTVLVIKLPYNHCDAVLA